MQGLSVLPLRTVGMEGRLEACYHRKENGCGVEQRQPMFVWVLPPSAVGNANLILFLHHLQSSHGLCMVFIRKGLHLSWVCEVLQC